MVTAARLVGYGLALLLAFGAAWGVGVATTAPTPPAQPVAATTPAPAPAPPGSGGLAAPPDGYTLVVQTTTFVPGRPGPLTFTVLGPDGTPVTAGPPRLAVVRRDSAGFQEPVATPGPGGLWRATLVLPAPGVYRMVAEVTPTIVLGTDLFAPGDFTPVAFAPTRVSQRDGYQVRLDGDLVAGRPSQVFVTVSRDGAAVTDLEPYGDGFGDLVLLRRGDLAYTRAGTGTGAVPPPGARSGPGIAFTVQVPTAGEYRVYLAFRHAGAGHVAEFTLATREGS